MIKAIMFIFLWYRAEDNDDVVNMLDYSAPTLKQQYGLYYISGMVLNPESTRTMIVAEVCILCD